MTVAIEQNNLGDLLKFEAPNLYSREEITVAQGQKLALGAIIGQDSETDLIKALNPAATDGTQNALGALIAEGRCNKWQHQSRDCDTRCHSCRSRSYLAICNHT